MLMHSTRWSNGRILSISDKREPIRPLCGPDTPELRKKVLSEADDTVTKLRHGNIDNGYTVDVERSDWDGPLSMPS